MIECNDSERNELLKMLGITNEHVFKWKLKEFKEYIQYLYHLKV